MNIKQIRELAEILSANGLTEIELCEGDNRIYLAKQQLTAPAHPAPAAQGEAAGATVGAPAIEDSRVDFNKAKEVKSSLIGVFYAASSPEGKPFVSVGSKVKKGDVLCIIEAMKLMNEIVSEQEGEIVDVCVNNGDVVEFGQTLFKLC